MLFHPGFFRQYHWEVGEGRLAGPAEGRKLRVVVCFWKLCGGLVIKRGNAHHYKFPKWCIAISFLDVISSLFSNPYYTDV